MFFFFFCAAGHRRTGLSRVFLRSDPELCHACLQPLLEALPTATACPGTALFTLNWPVGAVFLHDPAKLQDFHTSLCPFLKFWKGQSSLWLRTWRHQNEGEAEELVRVQSHPTSILVSYGDNSTTPEVCFGSDETLSARMPMLNAFNL